MNENIFKVGQTCNLFERLRKYPTHSALIAWAAVMDETATERFILDVLAKRFIQRTDYGTEYFEGPPHEIRAAFHTAITDAGRIALPGRPYCSTTNGPYPSDGVPSPELTTNSQSMREQCSTPPVIFNLQERINVTLSPQIFLDSETNDYWNDAWMSGHVVLTYDEMKQRWERRSFKIVQGGNYIREERERRVVMSDKVLNESYKHLHYAIVKQNDSGQASVQLKPFITQWVKDPLIRRYKGLVFRPPPMVAAEDTYNIWNGFAVNRYEPAGDSPVKTDGVAVKQLIDFLGTLCGHKQTVLDYLLDWMAQIFQYPSRKTGVAILLKGEEGVGKNRATDLLSAMLGPDKSLNTSSPKNTLYGEFTQLREGKFLIVINEANGADNFAANDIIKDMITSDTFVCNAKSQNSYSIECYARFIFTTNNDNCLKVESGSRRYQVINVSSELKGNTDYFKDLSAIIDDPHSRYEFYKYLMDRNISSRDWINDRPLTESFTDMVSMNLPFEFHFIKDLIMSQDVDQNDKLTRTAEELFQQFNAWMQVNVVSEQARARHNTSSIKFGVTLSKLVATDSNRAGFKSVIKSRKAAGVLYTFDIAGMQREMVEKHWVTSDVDPQPIADT